MGAGSVGGYVGGCLQAAGAEVHFVGRPRTLEAWQAHGLRVTDQDGRDQTVPPGALKLSASVPDGLAPSLVVLTVKCGATREAAAALGAALPAGTPVLSLQNGLGNAEAGAEAAPGLRWLAGMVPYNIAEVGPGHLHRGTGGQLAAEDDPAVRAWLPAFEAARLRLKLHADLRPVQWGKLLLNLNNAINALSGRPLRAELMERGYRQVFAALQREALAALAAAGIEPAQVAAVAPRRMPILLSLPDWLFHRVAKRMLRIDPQARSSMADDLALGRRTEVDALCGEVVRLARSHGLQAPLNERIQALIEAWPQQPGPLAPAELKARLGWR
ncbi:2-dehydropantoate 2-reductase [Ideonella sp. YS5]|uniref:2-dehydropantoate 2-reductase n=1 Tax=Ideonella sp. YS5 TaxID=3453714 RepID=UPI003EEFD12E